MITSHRKHLEQRCQQRGYTLADVMPCVVAQDGNQWTIDETHAAYPHKQPGTPEQPGTPATPPSLAKRTCGYIKAVNGWIKAGAPIRPLEECRRFYAICKACEHFDAHLSRCNVCGCALGEGPNAMTNKIRMATEDCPKGKWTVETKQHPGELARSLAEVAKIKPVVFVEIGVHAGGSLLRYSEACAPNAIVIGVDIGTRPEAANIPRVIEHLRQQGFSAHWIKGSSQSPEVIREAKRIIANQPIDCLHIDGSHKTDDVLTDWKNWMPMVRPGGMIIFHDVASKSNGVPAAWRKCREGRAYAEIVASGAERYRTGTGLVWLADARGVSPDIRISVIMPARQEGEQVRPTCESFLAHGADEIILIDDASTDGSCDSANLPAGVRVIHNETPLGVGRARNQGAALATGDVLIFADAHELAMQSLRPFAQAAVDHNAIICAAVQPLREGGSHGPGGRRSWTGYAARNVMDPKSGAYKAQWQMKRPKKRLTPVNSIIGACYAMTREVFNRLGGWVETRHWGYNEQGLALKAWFCGVPMLVDRDTIVKHQFKRKFKYAASVSGSQLNRYHAHAVLFDADTFATVWMPRFRKSFPGKVHRQAKQLLAEPSIQAEIADFQSRKARTDREFFEQAAPVNLLTDATDTPAAPLADTPTTESAKLTIPVQDYSAHPTLLGVMARYDALKPIADAHPIPGNELPMPPREEVSRRVHLCIGNACKKFRSVCLDCSGCSARAQYENWIGRIVRGNCKWWGQC